VSQILSAFLCNAEISNFKTGSISKGPLKNICVPGLNCYSCPAAIASCPLGALQNALGTGNFPFFAAGLILLSAITLGRTVCSFLCPFGLVQELLYKIPSPKLPKSALTRKLTMLKYLILAVPVIGLPLGLVLADGYGAPSFCKFICPAGTLEAGLPLVIVNESLRGSIGPLFFWKLSVLLCVAALSVFLFRPFCRFICPLGALYGFFNKYALFGSRLGSADCTHCGKCAEICKMDTSAVNDCECIRCGDCKSVCPSQAPRGIRRNQFLRRK
jgi:polyferredoxin